MSPIFDLLGSEQISAVSRSAPPSPRLRRGYLPSISVRNLISNFEQNHSVLPVAQVVEMAAVDEIKEEVANLKRVCTRFLNQLKKAEQEQSLDGPLLSVIKTKIVNRVNQLDTF